MIFERSKHGQENRSIFHGVDYTCYVEGGGGNDTRSEDVTFWKSLFSRIRPELKIRFIARGGKPELEKIAQNIIEQDIEKTLVAMDMDYDEILGVNLIDNRILYTYGYSWENDVFCVDFILKILERIGHADQIDSELEEFLRKEHERLIRELLWPVRADFAAFRAGTSILPRQSPGRVVKLKMGAESPKVDRREVLSLCHKAKKKKRKAVEKAPSIIKDISRHCVGHVYAFAISHIIKCAVKNYFSSRPPSPNHIRDIGIISFADLVQSLDSPTSKHYNKICCSI